MNFQVLNQKPPIDVSSPGVDDLKLLTAEHVQKHNPGASVENILNHLNAAVSKGDLKTFTQNGTPVFIDLKSLPSVSAFEIPDNSEHNEVSLSLSKSLPQSKTILDIIIEMGLVAKEAGLLRRIGSDFIELRKKVSGSSLILYFDRDKVGAYLVGDYSPFEKVLEILYSNTSSTFNFTENPLIEEKVIEQSEQSGLSEDLNSVCSLNGDSINLSVNDTTADSQTDDKNKSKNKRRKEKRSSV